MLVKIIKSLSSTSKAHSIPAKAGGKFVDTRTIIADRYNF
jgi:hypothetical protein